MLVFGVIGIAVAIALVAVAVGGQLEERADIRTSLRRVGPYEIHDTRDQALLEPVSRRTVAPILQRVVEVARRITPVGYVDRVRVKLIRAGSPEPEALDRFLVWKILGVALVLPALAVIYLVLELAGLVGLLAASIVAVVLAIGPDLVLDRRVERRVHEIRVGLPEILDLLVISVEAGLGFEQALDRVVDSVPGPLSEEFSRMLGEVRAGSSRSEGMRAMEERLDVTEVRAFILAMIQADTFGISIARVLRTQADEMRIRRRQLAQELAQKAPVKMLIPMVLCIFPALFVVVLAPAALDILDNF